MAIDGSGCNVIDRSLSGCTNRRAKCEGWAEASDANKRAARREARDEAKVQKDNAVTQAETTIFCPTGGCDAGQVCRQNGSWYDGPYAGSVVADEQQDAQGVWHIRHEMYVERRLGCGCASPGTAAQQQQTADRGKEDVEYFF
jgi:hypothetical protein